MKVKNALTLCFLISFLVGCETIPRHPDYLGDNAATLCGRTDPNPFNKSPNVVVTAVDGVRTPQSGCKTALILEPKTYKVGVFVNIISNASFLVEATLEPNKNYQIRGRYNSSWVGQDMYANDQGDKFNVYLLDRDTGEKIDLKKIKQ